MKLHLLFSERVMAEGHAFGLGCRVARELHGGAEPEGLRLLLTDLMWAHVRLGGSACAN